jgi:hypothetical protein
MILGFDSLADFAGFPSEVARCRRPALVESHSGNGPHAGSRAAIGGLCSNLVARCGGRALPEVSVNTEFVLARIIISPALPQKFPEIDRFEWTPRRHIV